MSTTLPADLRCPRCGAHVRPGSDWCTLCYTDLRPPEARPAPEPAAPPTVEVAVAAPSALPPEVTPEQQPRGKHARRSAPEEVAAEATAAPAPAQVDIDALAAPLLAQLAASESGRPFGRLSGMTDTTGKKAILMIGGTVVAAVALFAVMALLGFVV